ncbi:MAG: C39 family peptidase [Candidatus Peregrinibacteria bacterium]|nr:C39 family peptidase [Candidatus Peregrinibacteria bacterium]
MKKLLQFSAIFLLAACGPDEADFKSQIPERPAFEDRVIESEAQASQPKVLPEAVNNEAFFFPQAPDADWNLPWEEACEEASLLIAYHALQGEALTREEFRNAILNMVDWQKENLGHYEDTTVEETAKILEEYLEFTDYRTLENPSIEDLKKELAQGHLIVAPFAGRMLGNPFYSGEGPYYHMMVLKGYDSENFITNDVGTRRGHNFIYPYQTIMNALHDYLPTDIELGEAKVIVLK